MLSLINIFTIQLVNKIHTILSRCKSDLKNGNLAVIVKADSINLKKETFF